MTHTNPPVQGADSLHFIVCKTVPSQKKPGRKLTVEVITERLEGRNITLLGYGGSARVKSHWKCRTCEHEWGATVDNVLRDHGCPQCAGNAPLTTEVVTERLEGRNITLLRYEGSTMEKSQWRCDVCSYEWETSAGSVLSGRGCPACAEYGYKSSLPGTLYALRSDCGRYVKIGITNNFKRRFRKLKRVTPFDVSVIERIECDGQTARQFEKMFHDKFESAGFTGFDGATEWLQ
ncbi:hypothetical protein kpv79_67 [Klebsiella phage vB_KpnM_KpV79]|uniref:Treble clef zinc finger domain-containing protein n=1 Tax=Klebsiella phage vB_KpnM_KpV79 TaxID=2041212 RepID=A0A291LBL5_9CAUD|nr:endonuclease [Klebsiella phage vB_KpnM_KpV79]ATI16520.1 hypothetical protein kpv79_67 [Klebsiella phage vB_KpnM_KpV79]